MDGFEQPASFTCTACGECCLRTRDDSGVVMNHPDVQRLAAFLGLTEEAFIAAHAERIELAVDERAYEAFLLKFGEHKCRFLQDDNKCGVHEAKPMQCRHTPYRFFWDGTSDLWCMKDVVVDPHWTSKHVDAIFLEGLRLCDPQGPVNHQEGGPDRA